LFDYESKLLDSSISEGDSIKIIYLNNETDEITQVKGKVTTRHSRHRYIFETDKEVYLLDRYDSEFSRQSYAVIKNPLPMFMSSEEPKRTFTTQNKVGRLLSVSCLN
jgi:hypothetical protein